MRIRAVVAAPAAPVIFSRLVIGESRWPFVLVRSGNWFSSTGPAMVPAMGILQLLDDLPRAVTRPPAQLGRY